MTEVTSPLPKSPHLRLFLTSVAIAGAIFAYNFVTLQVLADDAYITFRYLDNWLAGHGLGFNPGDRVEGITNLLWVLLIAPFRLMGLPPEGVAVGLALLAVAWTAFSVYRIAQVVTQSDTAGLAAAIIVLTMPQVAHYASTGLETVAFAAFLAAAFAQLAVRQAPTFLAAVLFGLATLTRPDGLLFGVVSLGLGAALTAHSRADFLLRLRPLTAYALFPLGITLWRTYYYGDPLPNTFYVKATGLNDYFFQHGLSYFQTYLLQGGGALLAPLAGFALWRLIRRPSRTANWLLIVIGVNLALFLAYIVKIGGDYLIFHRFIVHVAPLVVVFAAAGIAVLCRGRPSLILGTAWGVALATCAILYTTSPQVQWMQPLRGFVDECRIVAEWTRRNTPPDAVIAINTAGMVPYLAERRAIDMLGLNDKHIARAKTAMAAPGGATTAPGHFKYDGDYVCQLRPDIVFPGATSLHPGANADDAEFQAVQASFESDRDFLRACANFYKPFSVELRPGRFLVAMKRLDAPESFSLHDQTPDGLFQTGLRLLKARRFTEAREAFGAILKTDPKAPVPRINIAYTYLDEGNTASAKPLFESLLKDFPSMHEAKYGLAMVAERSGDKQDARRLWTEYLLMDAPESWKQRARSRLESPALAQH